MNLYSSILLLLPYYNIFFRVWTLLREKKVKEAIQSYFKDHDFFVPPVELNIGVRPDVSTFKWEGTHELSAIGVECKAVRSVRSLIDVILNQAREYQLASLILRSEV